MEKAIESAGFYAIIPATVRYDMDLMPNAKLLFAEITALCKTEGYCWASNSYFAGIFGVSSETVSRWISQLVEKEYLFSIIDPSKGNRRHLTPDFSVQKVLTKNARLLTKSARPYCGKAQDPIDEKRKHNNIIDLYKLREGNALAFFLKNPSEKVDLFLMNYHKKIKDFQKFIEVLECKLDEEKIEFDENIIFARATRFAINYSERETSVKSFANPQELSTNHPSRKKLD